MEKRFRSWTYEAQETADAVITGEQLQLSRSGGICGGRRTDEVFG